MKKRNYFHHLKDTQEMSQVHAHLLSLLNALVSESNLKLLTLSLDPNDLLWLAQFSVVDDPCPLVARFSEGQSERIFWHKGILATRSQGIPQSHAINKPHTRDVLERNTEW